MSGHLVVADDADQQAVLVAARTVLHEDFGIDHTTIQIETAATRSTEVRTRV